MKNIQIIDDSLNCVYDIFAAPDAVFDLVFAPGTDIAFVEELEKRRDAKRVWDALNTIWGNRVRKCDVQGIHGTIFYGLLHKRQYYPTLRDEEAINPEVRSSALTAAPRSNWRLSSHRFGDLVQGG